ncbi:hypothetical protein [Micropruina sp.]|uniref:hypothetical protein n=1 Tax=Micropruina sp. TaxID=2737536 RepID=UPI0039E42BF1
MSRSSTRWASLNGRFAWGIVGAALASVVWLVAVLAFSLSPEQAAQRRAAPDLPPPTAVVQEVELRQVAWFPCVQQSVTVNVVAPSVPKGSRPVVTRLPGTVVRVRTGTELAQVSGIPLIAVVTDAVFYRDLRVGDRGPDVRGFEKALQHAGVIRTANAVLDAATLAAWRRFDPTGPRDRVRQQSLVAVPDGAELGVRKVRVGEVVKPGAVLLEVNAGTKEFRCAVPNAGSEVTPAATTFMVADKTVKVASVTVRTRTNDEPGYVLVIPRTAVDEGQGRLGVQSAGSGKPVLAVPLSAVRVDAGGRPAVVVVDGESQRETPVALGVTAQGLVEIAGDGIATGVQVLLFESSDQASAAPSGRSPAEPTPTPSGPR